MGHSPERLSIIMSTTGSETAGMGFGDSPLPGASDVANEGDARANPSGDRVVDRSDWDRFYADCDRVIVAALARERIQAADREDCRQQIWVELLATRMPGFRGGSPSAWLATLARNKAIDIIRRSRRHPVGLAIGELEAPALDAAESCPVEEAAAIVRVALAQLEGQIERRSFAAFVLRSIDGLPFGQIAISLRLTPEQARARHHRTKAKFRRIVEQHVVRGKFSRDF